jgi:hypothetical protein
MTHEELRTKAFDAAKIAFMEIAKSINPETGEPSFEDAVNAARSAVVDVVLHFAASIVEWERIPGHGLSPVECRAQLGNKIRAVMNGVILRQGGSTCSVEEYS